METKPGSSTSEFKAAFAAILLPIVNGILERYLGIKVNEDMLMLAIGIVGAYIGSRTWVKTVQAKAGAAAQHLQINAEKVKALIDALAKETDETKKAALAAEMTNLVKPQ